MGEGRATLRALLCLLGVAWSVVAQAAEPVVLWHSYRGAEETALTAVLDAFEAAHPEVPVEALSVPYDVMASKLTTAIPRNNGPDLFLFAHERIGGWAASGLLRPVHDWAEHPASDHFLPETIPPLVVDGTWWGLPLATKSLILVRNTELAPEAPETLDDLLTVARRVADPPRTFGIAYEAESFYFHAPWWFGAGGSLGAEAPLVDVLGPPFLESLTTVQGLRREGLLPEEPTGALVAQLFRDGRVPYVISGPWFLGDLGDASVPWALSALPMGEGGHLMTPFLTDEAVMVAATARHPDEASQVASWLVSEASARTRATVGGQVVATASAWDDPVLAHDPVLGAFRAQLAHTVPMDSRPAMRDVWEPTALALKKALRGGEEPALAAEAGAARYRALSRPQPPEADPMPFVLLAVTAFGGLLAVGWRWGRGIAARGELEHTARSWAWAAPATVATVLLVFVPFAVGVSMSLFAHDQGEWTFVGIQNYSAILSGRWFPLLQPLGFVYALLVTVVWTATNVVLHLTLGLGLALILDQKGLALKPLYRVILVLPWAVPNYITALVWKGLFHKQLGAINGMLEALGLDGVSWFSHVGTAFFANLCTNVWLGFPFMMVVCLGALQAIPSDLYEAAEVDGASWFDQLRHVTLPLLRPALVPALLLGTVWTFNQFNIVYLVSGGEPDGATEILISEAYRWAFTRREQYGYAAAYAVLIFVVLLGWSWVSTRISRQVEQETGR